MSAFVIEANVAIVANGKNTHADHPCQIACIEILEEVVEKHVTAIDTQELIFDEYKKYLSFSGQSGTGDMFFKHLFNHMYAEDRVLRFQVTPSDDDEKGFEELPKNAFDPADRKFLAVAVVANVPVLNATDSDWLENKALTDELGVTVEQLCPQYASRREA